MIFVTRTNRFDDVGRVRTFLEFREVFLKMIGDNKDKFADISWDTGKTKTEYVGRTSPFHSGKKEEYVVNHNTGETKMRYAKEPRQVKVYNSVIHELAQFLRDTATYIDSKDIEADKIMEEIVEERRIYAENRKKKEELEEAEWDAQMGL